MNSIEWFWNMRRKTLNLNTRRNIVCLGASLRTLMDNGNWALLPSEEIIMQYASTLQPGKIAIADRRNFPDIPDGIRPYRLLPLFRMEKLGITIQIDQAPVGPESFVNYVYPFDNLPDFDSHIHPKFAILALGKKLLEMETKSIVAKRVALNKLLEKFPILEEVRRLYTAWTAIPDAKDVAADGSYAAPDNDSDDDDSEPDIDDDDDDSDYVSDNKSRTSVKTKPRRVGVKKRKRGNSSPTWWAPSRQFSLSRNPSRARKGSRKRRMDCRTGSQLEATT
ncbi:hypothetical protein BJ912DRAFT_1140837 [Pholiota molesta]|nr:hypothetical protein BJ912DRAFT_1140837 [Pholiota molesta]